MAKGKHSKGKHDKKSSGAEQEYSYTPLEQPTRQFTPESTEGQATGHTSPDASADHTTAYQAPADDEFESYVDEPAGSPYNTPAEQPAYGARQSYDAPAGQPAYGTTDGGPLLEDMPTKKKGHKALWRTLIIIAAVLLAAYIAGIIFFISHFEPNSNVSGVDCSYKTVSDAEDIVKSHIDDYKLTIVERADANNVNNTANETIKGSAVDVAYVSDGKVSTALGSQNKFIWPARLFSKVVTDAAVSVKYDDTKLKSAISALNCMNTSKMVAAVDATTIFNGTEYVVQPEVMGTTLDASTTDVQIAKAVSSTEDTINLSDAGCYKDPSVYSNSPELQSKITLYNKYVPFSITYTFGDTKEVLDGNTAISWYTIDSSGNATLNEDDITDWVAGLASRHDTVGSTRTFTSADGKTVSVSGGTYGWQIDQDAEFDDIKSSLTSHTSVTRDPDYVATAASYGSPDWGSTYFECSISDQHWWYVQNGQVVLDTDCVTGLPTAEKATPTGVYDILDKQSPYTMHGTELPGGGYEYVTDCSYWMRVTWSGVGIHDAWWKSAFGGTEYQTSGSHGCINTPTTVAGELYGMIAVGTPVIIHD